jgi:hypothetical protein
MNADHALEDWDDRAHYVGPFRSREAALAYLLEECDTDIIPGTWLKQDIRENGPVAISPPRLCSAIGTVCMRSDTTSWREALMRRLEAEDNANDQNER